MGLIFRLENIFTSALARSLNCGRKIDSIYIQTSRSDKLTKKKFKNLIRTFR